ncbi:MAG: FHA domain-containing protein [Propionibacteriales bacterium]|nr:FHA domain-containing protein [Propionibacteriales bacterium]
MSEFTLTLIKFGFLALLWIFVLSIVSVIRSDLFGARVDPGQLAKESPRAPKQPKQSKRRRGVPTQLVITEGSNAGQTLPLSGETITLGRGTDTTIRLDDDYVSSRHARFVTNGEEWFVEDMGSTNGTYIGSSRVTRTTVINAGTAVRMGKTVVELRK